MGPARKQSVAGIAQDVWARKISRDMVNISSSGAAMKPQVLSHDCNPNHRSWGILERSTNAFNSRTRKDAPYCVSRRETGRRLRQKNRASQRTRLRLNDNSSDRNGTTNSNERSHRPFNGCFSFLFPTANDNNREQLRQGITTKKQTTPSTTRTAQSLKKRQGRQNESQ